MGRCYTRRHCSSRGCGCGGSRYWASDSAMQPLVTWFRNSAIESANTHPCAGCQVIAAVSWQQVRSLQGPHSHGEHRLPTRRLVSPPTNFRVSRVPCSPHQQSQIINTSARGRKYIRNVHVPAPSTYSYRMSHRHKVIIPFGHPIPLLLYMLHGLCRFEQVHASTHS